MLHYLLGRCGADVLSIPLRSGDSSDGEAATSEVPELDESGASGLEELLLAVSHDALAIACQPPLKHELERLTSKIDGVSIYCRHADVFGDAVSGHNDSR